LLRLFHPDELLPNVFGILPLIESENQKKVWLQSSIFKKNNSLHLHFNQLDLQLRKFSFHEKIDYLTITTTEDYVPILENYFKGHHKLKH